MGRIGQEVLGRLFDGHSAALVLYARQWAEAPQDVVQEAFVALARPRAAPDRPVAWLYRVVRNGALAAARGERRRRRREAPAAGGEAWFASAVVGLYRELYDDYFKGAYLPYPNAVALEAEVGRRVAAAKSGPAGMFAGMLPAIQAVYQIEAQLGRKIAALRVVEALRLHAAGQGGGLPESLDGVKAVPVPDDPMTGKPFEYRIEGESAVMTGKSPAAAFRLVYRITLRK